jgi:hypothetical protein
MDWLYRMLFGQGFKLVAEERFQAGMEVSFVNPAFSGFAGQSAADIQACTQRVGKYRTKWGHWYSL